MRLLERRLVSGRNPQPTTDSGTSRLCLLPGGGGGSASSMASETAHPPIDSPTPAFCSTDQRAPEQSPKGSLNKKLRRRLSAVNSLGAIKMKMFIFVVVSFQVVHAGFFTFYFPNILKPKGFHEVSDMINSLDDQINSTLDEFSDKQHFWGLLQKLDETPIENNYPEISACKEIFPVFRDLAIEYVYIDFEHYLSPLEKHREYLIEFRDEWYPAQHESKAALPREWEQKLLEMELQLKIDHLERLVDEQEFRDRRQKLVDIWRNIRRNLDDSVECLYMRYAFRQIAEDINQVALSMNLRRMRAAMRILMKAYERIAKWKASDEKIIEDINEEIRQNERFTIDE